MRVSTHRKLDDGSFRLVIDVEDKTGTQYEFPWVAVPVDEKGKPIMSEKAWTAMQVEEAQRLVELALAEPGAAPAGKKLASEGQKL